MFLHTHACWGERFKEIVVLFFSSLSQSVTHWRVWIPQFVWESCFMTLNPLIGPGVQLILKLCILQQGQARVPLHNKRVFRMPHFCSGVNIKIKIGRRRRIQIKASFYHKFCLSSCFQLVVGNVCWKKPTGVFFCLFFSFRLKIHAWLSNAVLSNLAQGQGMGEAHKLVRRVQNLTLGCCLQTLQLIMFTLLGLAALSEWCRLPRFWESQPWWRAVTMQVFMSDGCITPNTPPLLYDVPCFVVAVVFLFFLCLAQVLPTHTDKLPVTHLILAVVITTELWI